MLSITYHPLESNPYKIYNYRASCIEGYDVSQNQSEIIFQHTENSGRLLSIVISPSSRKEQAEVLSTRENTSI